ncbi:hypothetical protein [Chitinophaga arvensicola]|uniref:Uncharacterized protein n=1 Tax=Chitinophaga arvensicola TaxID=29529 RepID=A0A1I0QC46_9BACT|nr:hypothetical protein [Chitinophaga arvensicola]SEW24378.1 hypothetical protein SAMN04488122_1356 [Chitinophaga arvensicola]
MDSYQVGAGLDLVKFACDVNTFGLARSRALVTDEGRTTIYWTEVSTDASGDITRAPITDATTLPGKQLLVLTEISLAIFTDQNQRKTESERLTALYYLEGGPLGFTKFFPDQVVPNEDYTKVIVTKQILLIP